LTRLANYIGNEAVILSPSLRAGEGCGGICVVRSRPAVCSTGGHPLAIIRNNGIEVILGILVAMSLVWKYMQ